MLFVVIYTDDTTLYSKCDKVFGLRQQLECFELESCLQDAAEWRKKWLAGFTAEQTHLISFDQSYNCGTIDNGSAFEEKSSFKMLRQSFSPKLDWRYYIVSLAKNASKKIRALTRFVKFLFFFFFLNLP